MRSRISQEKGITIITVTTMVIVMLIIISTMVYYARNSIQMEAMQGLKADITEIESKALIYYVDTKAVPLKSLSEVKNNFEFGDEEFKNPNDSGKYYLVDLDKLGVTPAYNTNYYINEKTLTVYAQTPVKMNGKEYGRFKEDFILFNDEDTLEIPEWARNVPAEMFTYDENNYIIGLNTQFISSSSAARQYCPDGGAINWTNLIIPAYGTNGSPVAGIATGAFSGVHVTGSVKIPFTVKIISPYVFDEGCNIKELYCDANVVDINAFKNLKNVEKVIIGPNCQIPDGTEQNGGLFSQADRLKTIVIEGSSIGKYTFSKNCMDVENIYFLGNPNVIPEGAFLNCGHNHNLGIHTSLSETGSGVSLPSSITTFEPYCFKGTGINNMIFPSSTTLIDRGAFSDCERLTAIGTGSTVNNNFGTSLDTIASKAFSNTRLTRVNISNNTHNVAQDAFPTGTSINHY